jgi:hypothetical protein
MERYQSKALVTEFIKDILPKKEFAYFSAVVCGSGCEFTGAHDIVTLHSLA